MRALVIGGGIGGLAAAVGLRKVGIEAAVFERAPQIQEVGAAITIWSNAHRALQRLGLADQVAALADRMDRVGTYSQDGELLDETDLSELAARAGIASLCAHRSDVQRILAEALDPASIHTGCEAVGFEQDGPGVRVRFASGRVEHGDLLVGADGLKSAIRAQLLGPTAPRYAGCTAWRGVAEVDHPRLPTGQGLFTLAPGAQSGLHRCGQGRIYWFVASNAEAGGHDAQGGHKAAVLDVVRGWKTPVLEVIEATDESRIIRNDISDRPASDCWGDRRVTLLGDAIHSTTPNLGQGACMAIEDGVALAHALKGALGPGGEGVEAGLRSYEDSRRERTKFVTHTSHRLGFLFHLENGMLVKIRNWLMQRDFSRHRGLETFEKLLLFQPPEL